MYPGDFERRGLMRVEAANGLEYESPIDGGNSFTAESQYLVGGARIVMKDPGAGEGELHPDDRVTIGITDLIGTTSAVIDLVSGALVETSTYYPNGARETYRAPDTENDLLGDLSPTANLRNCLFGIPGEHDAQEPIH